MRIQNNMGSKIKALLLLSLTLLLTACEDEFSLLNSNNENIGHLKMQVTANSPSTAFATLNGTEYFGEWGITKVYEPDVAKRHRLISTRSYAEYMNGNSSDQLIKGHATLLAKNNAKLECDFMYRSKFQSGGCYLGELDQSFNMKKIN